VGNPGFVPGEVDAEVMMMVVVVATVVGIAKVGILLSDWLPGTASLILNPMPKEPQLDSLEIGPIKRQEFCGRPARARLGNKQIKQFHSF